MQSLIVGLLLALVSGMSVIAFRHPNGYARLFPYLMLGVSGMFVCVTVWHLAVELTWDKVVPYITAAAHRAAKDGKNTLAVPYEWLSVAYLAAMAFLWINLKLPPFLKHSDTDDSSEGND